jgi:hypothetical protein
MDLLRCDSLLQRILDGGAKDDDGKLLAELLKGLFEGYPPEELRVLLRHSDPFIVECGVWLASELGGRARPIFPDLVPLLRFTSPWVRSEVVICLLVCADPFSDGKALAAGASLIVDPEQSVRWHACEFLQRASLEHLRAATRFLDEEQPEVSFGVSWLLTPEANSDDAVGQMLGHASPILRRFGVVAAARLFPVSEVPFNNARRSPDEEIRRYADIRHEGLKLEKKHAKHSSAWLARRPFGPN